MLVLGIDPGTAITGFGLIETDGWRSVAVKYGCIRTEAKSPMPERLGIIYQSLAEIFRSYRPDMFAIEKLFFAGNANSAMQVGEARGVAILAAYHAGLEVHEYTPLQVKQAVAGYGKADKNQVQQMIKALLHLQEIPRPNDAADALAVALCHAHTITPGSRHQRRKIYV